MAAVTSPYRPAFLVSRSQMKMRKSPHPYYPVAGRRREESLLVLDEEEIRLALVEGSGEVVWLGVHDVIRQAEGRRQPVHGNVLVLRDVVDLEGDFDLQHVRVRGQHFPRSVDLHKRRLSIF